VPPGERPARLAQRPGDLVAIGKNAAAGGKARGDEGVAEQGRAHLDQRQAADQGAAALRDQIVRALATAALDRPAPLRPMEMAAVGMFGDEAVEPGAFSRIAQVGGTDGECQRRGRVHASRACSAAATWSVRHHSWSVSSLSSLGRIAERLV
jgi:hypothetical protein